MSGCACLGALSAGVLLQGCMATKALNATINADQITLSKSEFESKKGFFKYLIVRNDALQYPIYLFRFSELEYSALYLRCTHQGNELNAYGDKLVCSAHGSEFDNRGEVTTGPATEPLHLFPVKITNDDLIISITYS